MNYHQSLRYYGGKHEEIVYRNILKIEVGNTVRRDVRSQPSLLGAHTFPTPGFSDVVGGHRGTPHFNVWAPFLKID